MDRSFYVYCFVYICQLTSLSRVRNTTCIFINNVEFLIFLCRRSNRLIYWWPSKSIINEVHNCSNVTLYSYRGIFGRISNHHYLNHPGKLLSIHLIKQYATILNTSQGNKMRFVCEKWKCVSIGSRYILLLKEFWKS